MLVDDAMYEAHGELAPDDLATGTEAAECTQFLRQRPDVIAAFQALYRIRRKSFGYRPTRLFATRSSFPCKVSLSSVSV